MKAFITGVTGFVGSHLVDYLLEKKDVEIFGAYRWRSPMDNIKHVKDKINLVNCELRDLSSVNEAMSSVKPDVIFHLAAQSYVPASSSSSPIKNLYSESLSIGWHFPFNIVNPFFFFDFNNFASEQLSFSLSKFNTKSNSWANNDKKFSMLNFNLVSTISGNISGDWVIQVIWDFGYSSFNLARMVVVLIMSPNAPNLIIKILSLT